MSDLDIYITEPEKVIENPSFKSINSWLHLYLGPATGQLHNLEQSGLKGIRDENRNAIIPERNIEIDGREYFLSIKGCGAYEDMFFGDDLTPDRIRVACQDPALLPLIDRLHTGTGFVMGESWMGESPYGAQGDENAHDELKISTATTDGRVAISGAYICPVIGIVQYPSEIEKVAQKFFWCRSYSGSYYQVIRLVPSMARLYFESSHLVADPAKLFEQFNILDGSEITKFELNFIKSGVALLTLFTRSAKIDKKGISGLIYQDVWFDKDVIVAPDGIIHFADLEGLVWKTIPKDQYPKFQLAEWQKLVFEFLFALIKIDSYRRTVENKPFGWHTQREDLIELFSLALDKDLFVFPIINEEGLSIKCEKTNLPTLKIPLIERVK